MITDIFFEFVVTSVIKDLKMVDILLGSWLRYAVMGDNRSLIKIN